MGSFGNYLGATLGGDSEYDNSWVTNTYFPERQTLLDKDGKLLDLSDPSAAPDTDPHKYVPRSDLLGDVPGLLSDDTTSQAVQAKLHGIDAVNWESKTFNGLRDEKNALNPDKLDTLATAWTTHASTLKTESEAFKKSTREAISGKWSGASADAADAATQQVTKTSIYDFKPSSDAIHDRLTMLSDAFSSIRNRFPEGNDLILGGDFNKAKLDAEIQSFNSRYHLDGSGRLRNNSDGYVTASQAVDQMNMLKRSISDYQLAVQLFRDTYNPTVAAVAANFPNLPSPPDMKYGQQGPGPGPGGGPGGGPGLSGGGGGGGGSFGGTKPLNTNGFKPIDQLKLPDSKPIDPKQVDPKLPVSKPPGSDITDPTKPGGIDGLTNPVKSAMDAATGAAKDAAGQIADAVKNAAQGAQDPNAFGPQGPPEGVLGLGPQGLGGGGAGKGAAGVGGGGSMPLNLASGKAVDTPAAATAKASAPATGAGLGSGAGSPGAGAPAAGQRGDQNGKGHQVNKVLRRKQNGKDVIGDADAVVAVVGAPENQGLTDGSHVDSPERADQPERTSPNVRRIPGGPRRAEPPMQVPGQ